MGFPGEILPSDSVAGVLLSGLTLCFLLPANTQVTVSVHLQRLLIYSVTGQLLV